MLFSDKNLFTELLDSTPTCLVVLNEYRQIVYVNKAFKDLLKNKEFGTDLSLRRASHLETKNN